MLCSTLLFLTGCPDNPSEMDRQAEKKMQNAASLATNQPAPMIDFSMDRYLLSERLTRFNDPNKMTYLYVILPDSSWLKVTIIGKLSSTSKRLTRPVDTFLAKNRQSESDDFYTQEIGPAPDDMGVYGSSEPAKVGMTTIGSLIEIGGFLAYIYSETPLNFTGMDRPIIELSVEATDDERAALDAKLQSLQKGMQR